MKLASTWYSSTEILAKYPKTKSELEITQSEVRATKYQQKGRSPKSIKSEASQPTNQPTNLWRKSHDGEVEELVPAVEVLKEDGVADVHPVVLQQVTVVHLLAALGDQAEDADGQPRLAGGQAAHLLDLHVADHQVVVHAQRVLQRGTEIGVVGGEGRVGGKGRGEGGV